ncbi:hypothetical protein TSUD_119540 [Trifolium subterraneum]|uniref:F-box/LRR-repeat protein 15/At3g58940/PEG3-like LRR domain-containing protein n=1 Tax=Trifolium subterraneum TaxID=3900 RepID=A0A2Z6N842_TRISU|nr:hypothetical protein TSUD_119540 [Trifolium subterraneum]
MDDKKHRIKLPYGILTFDTLQVLKLTHLQMRDFDPVDFPQLKTLHMDRVKFNSNEHYGKFLSGCPVLEDLHVRRDFQYGGLPLENLIALPNLDRVRFDRAYTPMSLLCKAKIFHIEKVSDFSEGLPVFHNLTHMELSVHDYDYDNDYMDLNVKCTWVLGILPYFPKLQHFIIKTLFQNAFQHNSKHAALKRILAHKTRVTIPYNSSAATVASSNVSLCSVATSSAAPIGVFSPSPIVWLVIEDFPVARVTPNGLT